MIPIVSRIFEEMNENCDINQHRNILLVNDKLCGRKSSDRIKHGSEADINEFPWLALLEFKAKDDENFKSFMCSGTLINSRYVLTGKQVFFLIKID